MKFRPKAAALLMTWHGIGLVAETTKPCVTAVGFRTPASRR